jgi:hypothetical protein
MPLCVVKRAGASLGRRRRVAATARPRRGPTLDRGLGIRAGSPEGAPAPTTPPHLEPGAFGGSADPVAPVFPAGDRTWAGADPSGGYT